ncbi:MAG: 2-C-methyl-D-erythritol 4-phosphate cytidylyltransferase, partial [Actinomycetales bacterium]
DSLLDLALAPLAGRPLVVHAVTALLRSTLVGDVTVLVPLAASTEEVHRLLQEHGLAVPVQGAGSDGERSPGAETVVVHDALVPLAPPSLIDALVEAVVAGAQLAVPARPVVDALKRLDGELVVGRADRNAYVAVGAPFACLSSLWASMAGPRDRAAPDGSAPDRPAPDGSAPDRPALTVPRLLSSLLAAVDLAAVQQVPTPTQLFRVTSPDDLSVAEAMLSLTP